MTKRIVQMNRIAVTRVTKKVLDFIFPPETFIAFFFTAQQKEYFHFHRILSMYQGLQQVSAVSEALRGANLNLNKLKIKEGFPSFFLTFVLPDLPKSCGV